ncbi:MAG: hypothetical protein K6B69_08890 [Lachnospiraceae bacterium]|nr:hypothetical protein [Lachnospiraceae bacterium]
MRRKEEKDEEEHYKGRNAWTEDQSAEDQTWNPTFEEASTNVMIEKSFETGEAEGGILNGIENAERYEADIRIINIMRMDFELLSEIIEDLDDDEGCWMKGFLKKQKMLKEIACERGMSYDTLKRRVYKLRCDIREEIIECLEMNCRGGM